MSIRPVDFNGMIQRTQDVSTLKQNEDNRPVVEQQMIFSEEMKKTEEKLHQVTHPQEKLGEMAAELLLGLLKEGSVPESEKQILVKPKLVIRESCISRKKEE